MSTSAKEAAHVPYRKTLVAKARANRYQNPTPAEKKFWFEVLRNKSFAGLKFTRQKPLGKYVVDFYCAQLKLAIEIDGDTHTEQPKYDEARTQNLKALGVTLIRYTNRDVLNNLEGVHTDLHHRLLNPSGIQEEGGLNRGKSKGLEDDQKQGNKTRDEGEGS